jgi:hypothetical protein
MQNSRADVHTVVVTGSTWLISAGQMDLRFVADALVFLLLLLLLLRRRRPVCHV